MDPAPRPRRPSVGPPRTPGARRPPPPGAAPAPAAYTRQYCAAQAVRSAVCAGLSLACSGLAGAILVLVVWAPSPEALAQARGDAATAIVMMVFLLSLGALLFAAPALAAYGRLQRPRLAGVLVLAAIAL